MTCAPTKVLSVPVTSEVSGFGIDAHRLDHEGLGHVRAALRLDDRKQVRLETPARGRIGDFEDLAHPVFEPLGTAIEQHQRGIAGDKFEIVGSDPGARDRQRAGDRGKQDDLTATRHRKTGGDGERDRKTCASERKSVSLAQQDLLPFVREREIHGCDTPLSQPASSRQWEGGVDFSEVNPAGRYQ